MAYALLSDIHGDDGALRLVLDELTHLGIDDGIVLGDVAQGGDEPAAVLDRLAELGWPVVLGNADDFLLEVPAHSNEEISEEQLARREWTLSRLEERHLAQIRSWPRTVERGRVLAFHGSPADYEDILFPDTEDDSPWRVPGYDLLAGGHTHFQWLRRIGDAVYVNPGSVGLAVDNRSSRELVPYADYAIVTDASSVEFRRCARSR